MKLPQGYTVERVLSAGPTTIVALARGPRGACVVKGAAIGRAIPAIAREAAALRALAKVAGVPRLLEAWDEGLAIERLAMPTLREHALALREGRERPDAAARGAFERLAAVHDARDEAGVPIDLVHGDVSPDNLYVGAGDDAGEVVLADFGLARWRGGPAGDAATEGAFRGTLLYAAPEVARGEPFDGRADDFALAASLLHVVTGAPLRGDGPVRAEAVLLVEAGTRGLDASHPWRSLAPALFDPQVAEALLACLAFDPRDRPRRTPRWSSAVLNAPP